MPQAAMMSSPRDARMVANANSDTLLNIPLNYYDKDAAAPDGNYTIIISCATSRYGDYLNGTENDLYVKDIEWIY